MWHLLLVKLHTLILVNNYFDENIAFEQGGGIYYNTLEPFEYTNNTFTSSNFAPYGSEIASYPTDIKILEFDPKITASGQVYTGRVVVEVVDDYN